MVSHFSTSAGCYHESAQMSSLKRVGATQAPGRGYQTISSGIANEDRAMQPPMKPARRSAGPAGGDT